MIKKRRKFAKNDFEVSAWVSLANIVQHIPEDPLRWLPREATKSRLFRIVRTASGCVLVATGVCRKMWSS